MRLEEQLLTDYGTIPRAIGLCLLQNNARTLAWIRNRTGLPDTELCAGLAILIRLRIVKFFIFEKTVKYYCDKAMLKRRLYFPLYLHCIANTQPQSHYKLFQKVLTLGTLQVEGSDEAAGKLIDLGILQHDISREDRSRGAADRAVPKISRTGSEFVVVNFAYLDSKIYEQEVGKFVAHRYNEAAKDVFEAVLRCDQINRANIIQNLHSSKILILDGGIVVNDKNNIDEYLRYLCSCQVLVRGADQIREYFVNNNSRILKLYRINRRISDPTCRRLFNMIAQAGPIEDKLLTVTSLLSINRIKDAVLRMQKAGLLQQLCLDEYKGGSRMEHSWALDLGFACRMVTKSIEQEICEKLELINKCWDVNYFMGNAEGNENVWMSDLICLATDHLIMSLD